MASRLFPKKVFIQAADISPSVLANVQFIDVRYDLAHPNTHGPTEHKKSRPTGSVLCMLDTELSDTVTATSGRHPLPPCDRFVKYCMQKGIGARPSVCFDDKGGGMAASRMWWMLDTLGHEAYVLDGGIQAYTAAGLPLESGEPFREHVVSGPMAAWPYATAWPASAVTADHKDIDPLRYVDSRTADRFGSTVRPHNLDKFPGRIDKSVNLPWPSNVVDGKLKPLADIKAGLETALRGHEAKDTLFGCASGVTACINIALSTHLGLGKPRLYSGSWSSYESHHKDALRAKAMADHGVIVTQIKKLNMAGRPASWGESIVAVQQDGRMLSMAEAQADASIAKVVGQLKEGEACEAERRDGTKFSVQVDTKSKL